MAQRVELGILLLERSFNLKSQVFKVRLRHTKKPKFSTLIHYWNHYDYDKTTTTQVLDGYKTHTKSVNTVNIL